MRRTQSYPLVFLLVVVGSALAQTRPTPGQPIALINANVIPMNSERVLAHQTILIKDGSITAIGPTGEIKVDNGVLRIDCTGKYVIPGLSDMHVHLQRNQNADLTVWMLKLFIVNGVTTVRNMWGTPEHLDIRKSIERGELLGPTVITAGPILDGSPPVWKDSTVVQSVEEARDAVIEQHKLGYDFIKVYSHLTPEAYHSIVTTAHDIGMVVVGHTPVSVGVKGVLASGQKSIEHLEGYITAIETDDSPVAGRSDWYSQMVAYGYVDAQKLRAIATATAASDTWNCPTLVAATNWVSSTKFAAMRNRPDMQYVPDSVWNEWRGLLAEEFRGYSSLDLAKLHRAENERMRIVKALHDADAKLLVGTDTPNPLVPPGFSLHEEMRLLVASGLRPYDVLRASTRDAAEFLGLHNVGTIETGKRADLVILDANPLEHIENAARISGVVARGRWFSTVQLASLLHATPTAESRPSH